MNSIDFDLSQIIQLIAFAPCVLLLIYLPITSAHKKYIIIPCLYFLVLAIDSIHSIFFLTSSDRFLYPFLFLSTLTISSYLPSLSFLLVVQFLRNDIPKFSYWFVLLVPVSESVPFLYSYSLSNEACLDYIRCFDTEILYRLNFILISSVIYLFLIFIISRADLHKDRNSKQKKIKYWIILSLMIFCILLLCNDLLEIQKAISKENYLLIKAIIKVSYIYIVFSSIFRVFSEIFDINHMKISYAKKPLNDFEEKIAENILKLLNEDKIYREMDFNRGHLAKMLETKEHIISRIINMRFKKSFSCLINDYRIAEAKKLIEETDTAITVITFDIGFNSVTSFNRVFKDYTGLAPTKYREEYKKK